MSLNYASSLSPYVNKGKCGQPEVFDKIDNVKIKCKELAKLIRESKSIVAITGAGISTSCGIPDFRGPKGVWTLEEKGETPKINVSFEDALPSFAHFALVLLEKHDKLDFLISQNIDGLHHRSGFPLNKLAELHGNMFITKCNHCNTRYISNNCVTTVGLKPVGKKCTKEKQRGVCRGEICDTILDWEDSLPTQELELSELNCKNADLCLCLGTTLQILPCGNLPLFTKNSKTNPNGKIVVVNLQPTRVDKHADLIINYKLDYVFQLLIEELSIFERNCENYLLDNNIYLRSTVNDLNFKNKYLINTSDTIINLNINYTNSYKCELKLMPNIILLFSGKRKSGKDYVCTKLFNKFNSKHFAQLITISAPLKKLYSDANNIDFEKLLDSSDYKEKHRKDMIRWSEEKRLVEPSYFCEMAVNDIKYKIYKVKNEEKSKLLIWIVTDIRRHTDIDYFNDTYPNRIKLLRVIASEQTRKERNWVFTNGIDDVQSECDLDDIEKWDFTISNNNDEELNKSLTGLINLIENFNT